MTPDIKEVTFEIRCRNILVKNKNLTKIKRILTISQKGIFQKHIANKTYDVYSIDYGTYTSLDINKTTLSTNFSELLTGLNTVEEA